VEEFLGEDHPVWLVLDLVDVIDLSGFHGVYVDGGAGRPAYDPAVMLGLLVWGYTHGMRSSRKIARACREDLAFMVICGGLRPDHRTIARFRQVHEGALADVFYEVLRVCYECGLLQLGTIALDGTKIAADASLQANRSKSWIAQQVDEILAEAAAADSVTQPDLAGELPEVLTHAGSRRVRVVEALDQIHAQETAAKAEADAKAAEQRAEAEAGRRPKGPRPSDPVAALERAEIELVAVKARQAKARTPVQQLEAFSLLEKATTRLAAATAVVETAEPAPEPQANITDPDSRIMATTSGWVQGYNGQAMVDEGQITLAALLSNHANDVNELDPVMTETIANLERLGLDATEIGVLLADAGYWSEANATSEGPDRLIATQKDHKQRKAAQQLGTTTGPPPNDATEIEKMEHRLRTPEGAAAYAKRSQTVEPVFGQTKENRGIRRLMRRGLAAAQSEWSFICTTHNINKLITHANGRSLHTILNPTT
jgi:transposase